MKVIAIDPGYDRLGVSILEGSSSHMTLLYSGCVTTEGLPHSKRLSLIGHAISRLLKEHRPDALAIETLFFNKNATTALGVAEVRGVAIYLAEEAGCTLHEFGPQEVKVAVTGYGKSDKAAVISMVKRLVKGSPLTAHDDEYDAIAVGVTALAHYRKADVPSS